MKAPQKFRPYQPGWGTAYERDFDVVEAKEKRMRLREPVGTSSWDHYFPNIERGDVEVLIERRTGRAVTWKPRGWGWGVKERDPVKFQIVFQPNVAREFIEAFFPPEGD